MRVALVHDYLNQLGGAEQVLKALCEIFPQSPIFTIVYDPEKLADFNDKKIIPSFIQNLPFGLNKYQWFLPLMPSAVEKFNLKDFDLIISSCSSFSKGVITRPEQKHICYCHTPTRYLWSDTHNYVEDLNVNKYLKKYISIYLSKLRLWDKISSDRVDHFIANSAFVQKRIKKYYNKESLVIHPPVETEKFFISNKTENYFLTGGRLVPYKRFDIAVKAFSRIGIPLKIFGTGPEYYNLKKIAKKNIEFVGKISEYEQKELYAKAIAFINPQVEDFGITTIEAMASGRPIIAYKAGGALETVIENKTGVFFEEQEWEDLATTVINFQPENFNPLEIKLHAENFSKNVFKEKILNYVKITSNNQPFDKLRAGYPIPKQ